MASNFNEYCLLKILENLSGKPKQLYSCIQINHHWSKIAVSILWRNHPWKYTFYSMKFWKPISHTILLSLPTPVKESLVFNDISKSDIINKNPMYNYISYCQLLSQNFIIKLSHGIFINKNNNYFNRHFLIEELWKLFLNNLQKIDYFIVPNDPSLSKFYTEVEYNFIFQSITKFECSTRISPVIFHQLSKISNNISDLIVYIYFNYPDHDNQGLATLISGQKNLKNIKFISYDYGLNKKCPNLSNSLKFLTNTLISLQFKEEDISFLSSKRINAFLINLKHLSIDLGKENIFSSKNLNPLNSIKLPLLEILEITLSEINLFDPFISLLQQTKHTLRKIKINTNIKDTSFVSNYINTIISYCPLVEVLNIWVTNNELNDVEVLLDSCVNLKNLELEAITDDVDNEVLEAKPFLQLFSRELSNLKEINLTGKWKFTKEELEDCLIMFEEHKNFGLKIEFHCVNGDKNKFEEICQKFDEKGIGILKKYKFEIISS